MEEGTSFWKDKWCSNSTLGQLFPELYSRALEPAGSVLSQWSHSGWDIKLPLSNQVEGIQKREELLQLCLVTFSCNVMEKDHPSWEWDPKRLFSVKNAYFRLNNGGLQFPYAKVIWTTKVPPKIKAFIWLVINEALLTWDNLMKRGWTGPGICVTCVGDEEIIDHLFLHCSYARYISEKLSVCLNLSTPQLPTT